MGETSMKKLLLGVVMFHLGLVPCFADVIPTRRVDRDASSEQKVKSRLQQLGISSQDAERQVRDMTPDEATYFAQNPGRVQYASGLYWYEWVGGLVFIVVLVAIVW